MRKLIGSLGLVALCTACPHRTEGLSDASAPVPAEVRQPLADAGAEELPPTDAGAGDAGAVEAGERPGPTDAGRPGVEAGADAGAAGTASRTEEACLDRWLEARGLDRYGHPEGTMYAGGTPLFDEATGERTERRTYVYRKHPQARAACASGTEPPPERLPVRQ